MVLKGVNWVNNTKIKSYDLERSQFATEGKIWSNGLKRSRLSKLGTQCKNQFIWS